MEKSGTGDFSRSSGESVPVIFATYAADEEQLQHALYFAESVRTFAGRFQTAPIWLYTACDLPNDGSDLFEALDSLEVDLRTSETPPEALRFYYAGKVFVYSVVPPWWQDYGGILSLDNCRSFYYISGL